MTEITPRGMLKMMRQQSHTFTNQQAQLFMSMSAQERMELLFYMAMGTNAAMQQIHSLIQPGGAEIQGMPEDEKGH